MHLNLRLHLMFRFSKYDWISFILKTQDFRKKKSTEEKYKSYQWGCCPEFLDRRCQSTGNSQRYHYPKQQQLLGCFRSFLRFLRVLHHHLVFPTSNLVLWQLYNRRIPFKFWKYWKSGRKSRRKSSVIFLPSGHNIVHVLFICTQCSLGQPRLNVSRRNARWKFPPWSSESVVECWARQIKEQCRHSPYIPTGHGQEIISRTLWSMKMIYWHYDLLTWSVVL